MIKNVLWLLYLTFMFTLLNVHAQGEVEYLEIRMYKNLNCC